MIEQSSFAIVRTWMGVAAMLLVGIAFTPSRTSAQAADGPQAGAPPSDSPAAVTSSPHTAQIGGHPSLAGTWTLNKDKSDDPREKMRQAMGGGNGEGGNGNGGGFGGGGGRGMGGGRRSGGGQGDMNAEFSQLTIAQTATSAKVTGSSGRVLAQYSSDAPAQPANSAGSSNSNSPDADNSGDNGPRGNFGPAPAEWQGNQLVATLQGRRGGSTTRTYELSPDGSQLYVTTTIDNPRFQGNITFRFVYDAANSNGGANQ